jgi:N-acetylglucosamine malate deacetylase 1
MFYQKKILAISPHTDDIEISAGGTLAKLIRQKNNIFYIALSDCPNSLVTTKFKKHVLTKECRNALSILGISKKNIYIHSHKEKFFYKEKRKIYERLEMLRDSIKPDIVIIPSRQDTHEDHFVVADQALTVFRRNTSIIAYEQPWNNLDFHHNLFISLTTRLINQKILALEEYKTQKYFHRSYFDKDFIIGLARTRGEQICQKYAESFEIIKYID